MRPTHPARGVPPALACALLLLAVLAAAGCSLPAFSVTPRAGYLRLAGDVSLDTGGVRVTGSASDLDLNDPEVVPQPRIDVDWGGLHLSAQGIRQSLSGRGEADVTVRTGGGPITARAPVDTDFDFGIYSVEAAHDLLPTDFIDVGLGVGLGLIDYDIKIRSLAAQDAYVRADDTLPFGYLMARVAKDLWRFRFLVNLRGLAFKLDGDELTYGDVDASVSFSLFGPDSRLDGRLVAGYRFLYADAEYENGTDVDIDRVTLQGPFVGLAIDF